MEGKCILNVIADFEFAEAAIADGYGNGVIARSETRHRQAKIDDVFIARLRARATDDFRARS